MFGLFKKRVAAAIVEPHESNLVPRIKNTQFLAATNELRAQGLDEPATDAFVGDLIIAYAFDLPHLFQFASKHRCAELGLTPESTREVALRNLRTRIPSFEVQGKYPIVTVTVGDSLEACLLLLDEVCESFARKCDGDLVAAVPNRDTLVFTDSKSELGVLIASETVAEFYPRGGNHALTRNLLCWKDRRWEVFRWVPPPQ